MFYKNNWFYIQNAFAVFLETKHSGSVKKNYFFNPYNFKAIPKKERLTFLKTFIASYNPLVFKKMWENDTIIIPLSNCGLKQIKDLWFGSEELELFEPYEFQYGKMKFITLCSFELTKNDIKVIKQLLVMAYQKQTASAN